MKKLLLTIATTAMFITATAYADDNDGTNIAYGVATMLAYNQQCEKVPRTVVDAAYQALGTVSNSAIKTATDKVLTDYKRAGLTAYCAIMKPIVERTVARIQ